VGSQATDETPRHKTRRLLRHWPVSKQVKKSLVFHHAVVEDIRARYENSRSEREKQCIARLFTGGIVRRCKMQKFARNVLGIHSRMSSKLSSSKSLPFVHMRAKRTSAITGLKRLVQAFYDRDDVSRCTTGKKDTKTVGQVKKQKRVLNDSLKNLHIKFLAEHASNISYSLFCKLRPFWVVIPRASDRDTCMCKIHSNMMFMAAKLHQQHVISTTNLDEVVDSVVCDSSSLECMYGLCPSCKDRDVEIIADYDKDEEIWWWEWITKKEVHERKKGDSVQTFTSQITVKEKHMGSLYDLVMSFQQRMTKLKQHTFNIRHQYRIYRKLKMSMSAEECIIHIDFAENYLCKYSTEIQSVHFGGSHKQVTLHTGVLYVGGKSDVTTFCTISDSTDHSPAGIWAYLQPVFADLKAEHPSVSVVHFFSDSPSTQYRQRKMFYLFCTELYSIGFMNATWNFFEAGHGKGAPDGVGGALKRAADSAVATGCDIPDAGSFYRVLVDKTSIRLYFVSEGTVCESVHRLPENISSIAGTMTIHQLVTVRRGELVHRRVSCTCSPCDKYDCACFNPKRHVYSSDVPESSEVSTGSTSTSVHNEQSGVFQLPQFDIDIVSADLIGQYCCVEYDGKPYPGVILDIDDADIQVQCMHAVGENRFFWPQKRPDVCWYSSDRLLALIPEPQNVTNRHKEVNRAVWSAVKEKLSSS